MAPGRPRAFGVSEAPSEIIAYDRTATTWVPDGILAVPRWHL